MASVLDTASGGSFLNLFIACSDADGCRSHTIGKSRMKNKRHEGQRVVRQGTTYDVRGILGCTSHPWNVKYRAIYFYFCERGQRVKHIFNLYSDLVPVSNRMLSPITWCTSGKEGRGECYNEPSSGHGVWKCKRARSFTRMCLYGCRAQVSRSLDARGQSVRKVHSKYR